MPENIRVRPTASVAPPYPPLLAPQPPIAPSLPPVHAVDLMTLAGSAVFEAQWRGMEARIVECPALSDAMPEFKTTYDVDPYAGVVADADGRGGGGGPGREDEQEESEGREASTKVRHGVSCSGFRARGSFCVTVRARPSSPARTPRRRPGRQFATRTVSL